MQQLLCSFTIDSLNVYAQHLKNMNEERERDKFELISSWQINSSKLST